MSDPVETALTVRVQARGGKFLGDDVGGASVVVRNAMTSEVLATGVTRGDSGSLAGSYQPGASRETIVTPGDPPTVNWLVAQSTTSKLDVALPLDRPTPIEVLAFGPLGGLQSAHRATAVQWIVPGQPNPERGWVIGLPGLVVQVLRPPTHRTLATGGGAVQLAANVTMMCGCPIGEGEPWLPSDFEVTAVIRKAGAGEVARVPLAIDAAQEPSIFVGETTVQAPGDYEAAISAVQKSTGNAGAGLVTFIVPGS
jgi:hypothetical protein